MTAAGVSSFLSSFYLPSRAPRATFFPPCPPPYSFFFCARKSPALATYTILSHYSSCVRDAPPCDLPFSALLPLSRTLLPLQAKTPAGKRTRICLPSRHNYPFCYEPGLPAPYRGRRCACFFCGGCGRTTAAHNCHASPLASQNSPLCRTLTRLALAKPAHVSHHGFFKTRRLRTSGAHPPFIPHVASGCWTPPPF